MEDGETEDLRCFSKVLRERRGRNDELREGGVGYNNYMNN
jgi:hypothetical protein